MNMNPLALHQLLRSASPAGVLSFVLPKESSQRKGAPAASPGCAGCSALLSRKGALRNSGLRPSDSPRALSLCVLRCSTTQRADWRTDRSSIASGITSRSRVRSVCSPPRAAPSNGVGPGAVGEDCLRAARPKFRSRPAARVAQGTRRSRARNAGVAFSLATFFWRRKRKYARASGAESSISATPQKVRCHR